MAPMISEAAQSQHIRFCEEDERLTRVVADHVDILKLWQLYTFATKSRFSISVKFSLGEEIRLPVWFANDRLSELHWCMFGSF